MPGPELVVIGIDGATFSLIDPWVKQGFLPNIAGMLQTGVRAVLQSTYTPNACPAWKSFATGKNPGRFGLFNWKNKVYGSYEPKVVELSDIGGRELWQIIGQAERRVAVVGMPLTYPPRPVNGALLTGMLTPPDADFAYPSELEEEILKNVGEYRLDPAVESAQDAEELFAEQNATTINRFQALRYLLKNGQYDFVIVVFTAPERLQHWFWPPHNARGHVVLRAYQQIDWAIAQLRGFTDAGTTFMLASSHGFKDMERKLYPNQLFLDLGWLKPDERGIGWSENRGVTRDTAEELVQHVANDRIRAKLPEERKQLLTLGAFGLDMTRTKAWAWSGGEVFINLKGREPQGIVEPGNEYESLRDRIIDRVEHLEDAGRFLDIRVFRREEIYSGRLLDHAPDLMIDIREPGYAIANDATGLDVSEIFPGTLFTVNKTQGGTHDTRGIFIAAGPHIQQGTAIENAHITDVAPTALHLMGLPIPDDMDGAVLPIFRKGSPPAERPVQCVPVEEDVLEEAVASREEQAAFAQVLWASGYLA